MKIYELVILAKLGLSKKFPHKVLHARKLAFGVGILKLTTIITFLALKLYLRYKRFKDKIVEIIKINKENARL